MAPGKNDQARKVELVISNLDVDVSDEELHRVLSERVAANAVQTVEVQRHPDQASRGWALVWLDLGADGEAARRAWHGTVVRGRAIVARFQRANFALNKQLSQAHTWQHVLHLFEQQGGEFNSVNIATAVHRLGRLGRERTQQDARLRGLVSLAEASLTADVEQWGSREISNVAWGMAKINMADGADGVFAATARATHRWLADFNPQDLSNAIWAFSTRPAVDADLFAAFAKRAVALVADMSPQGLSSIASSFAKASHFDEPLFSAISSAAQIRIFEFDPVGLAHTAHAYASVGMQAPELFGAVADASLATMDRFDPRALAMLASAFVQAKVGDPELFAAVAAAAEPHVLRFTGAELGALACACATAGFDATSLLEAVARAARACLRTFEPEDLAAVAWALAAARGPALPLLEDVACKVVLGADTFEPRDLGRIVWAFAAMASNARTTAARLTASSGAALVAAAAALRVADLAAVDLADVLWAYAASGAAGVPASFFEALAAAVPAVLPQLCAADVARVAWALATLGVAAPDVFGVVAANALARAGAFRPQDGAVVAWACAAAGVPAPALFRALGAGAAGTALEGTAPPHVAALCWAFAEKLCFDAQLFDAVSRRISAPAALAAFGARHLATVACAHAALNAGASAAMDLVAAEAATRNFENARDVAQLAWALTALHAPAAKDAPAAPEATTAAAAGEAAAAAVAPEVTAAVSAPAAPAAAAALRGLLKHAFDDDAIFSALADDDLRALHDVVLFLRHAAPPELKALAGDEAAALKHWTPETLARLRDACAKAAPAPAAHAPGVAAALERIGCAFEAGHVTEQGLVVDFADAATMRAVLVDGPARFVSDADGAPAAYGGAAALRHRLLTALGWKVARVPFYEWDALAGAAEAHEDAAKREDAYLRGRLAGVVDAGVGAPPRTPPAVRVAAAAAVRAVAALHDAALKGPQPRPPEVHIDVERVAPAATVVRQRRQLPPSAVPRRKRAEEADGRARPAPAAPAAPATEVTAAPPLPPLPPPMPPLMMPPPMPPPMLPPPLPPSLLPLPLSGYALAAQMHAPYAGGAYYAEDRYYVHEAPRDPYRAHAAPQHRAADWSRSPPRTRRMTPEEYAAQYYGDGAGPSAGYDEVAAIVNSTRALAAMRAMHQADRYRQQYFAPPSLLYDDRAAYATDAPYAHRAAYPGADHDLRAAYPVADLRAAYAVVADRQNEHRSHEEVAGEQSCSGLPAKYNGPPPPAAARALQPRNTAADHHAPAGLEPWRYH